MNWKIIFFLCCIGSEILSFGCSSASKDLDKKNTAYGEEPLILIDTVLENIGHIIISGKKGLLKLVTTINKDTLLGTTNHLFWKDSIPIHDRPIDVIGTWRDNKLIWTNIIYTPQGLLLFAIKDQWERPNIYGARISDGKWKFLCPLTNSSCSIWSSTVFCRIVDEERGRLLDMQSGISYDEELDLDYHSIKIIQYLNTHLEYIGEVKIKGYDELNCDLTTISKWYEAYSMVANRDSFNLYLY